MFIPLAPTIPTTSTPSSTSSSTPPLDDGITTVKHYLYTYTNLNPRTDATAKKYHCYWHDNIKCQSHCVYNNTCHYRCCPEMCSYCSRGYYFNSYNYCRMTSSQIASTTSTTTTTKTATSSSNTVPTMARESTQISYCVCSNNFGGIPHQNKPSSCS